MSHERFALWVVLIASLIDWCLFYLTDGSGLGAVLGTCLGAAGSGLLHRNDRNADKDDEGAAR